MTKIIRSILVLIFSVIPLYVMADDVETHKGIYLAGFVVDSKGNKIEGAKLLLTSRAKLLSTLSTLQGGWFEMPSPIYENEYCKKLNVTVIKRGYQVKTFPVELVKENKTWLEFEIPSIEGYGDSDEIISRESSVLYGYIEDGSKTGVSELCTKTKHINRKYGAVGGAVVTLQDGKRKYKTVSRESGYFSLYYPDIVSKSPRLIIDHDEFDATSKELYSKESREFKATSLKQNWRKVLYGFGGQQIRYSHVENKAKLVKDQNWFGAWVFNVSYFPNSVLLKDHSIHHGLSSSFGFDFSVAHSSRLEFRTNDVKDNKITTVGVGGVYIIPGSDFLLRAGIALSDDEDRGAYIGISIPFNYFKKPFYKINR